MIYLIIASREQYTKFRPYYNMDRIEDTDQYNITDEHRRLLVIEMV